MAKTAAEKQAAYRERAKHRTAMECRQREAGSNADGNGNAPKTVTRVTESVTDYSCQKCGEELTDDTLRMLAGINPVTCKRCLCVPLDVYSEQRWSFLQSRGYAWDADRQRGVIEICEGACKIAVTVPGDPAYDEAAA